MTASAVPAPQGEPLEQAAPAARRSPSFAGELLDLPLWQRRTALLLFTMTLVRLFVIRTTGLSDTETYYLAWSRFPAWSYYDHPPLVAWLAWLTTLGSRSAFAVRAGPVVCAAIFGILVYRLAARRFSPRAAFFAVAIVSALPGFVFISFLLNPEAPLAPLWLLALLLLDDLRSHDEPWRPLALGAVVGVAFLAKYTAVLLVPVTLLYLLVSPEARRWLRRPALYLGGLVALALATPVLAWNYARHWPSLALHLVERMGEPRTFATHALHVALGQVVLFHPLMFPGLLATAALTVNRARRDPRYRLLAVASVPVLLFFYVLMARVSDAEPHWTALGYVPLAIAAGGLLDEVLDRPARALTFYLRVCFGVSGALGLLYVAHTRTPALLALVPPSAYDANADPFNETLAWDGVKTGVAAAASRLGPGAVAASSHNVMCGHLLAALDDRPAVYCPSPRRTEFDFLGRRDPPAGAPVVYLDSTRYPEDPSAALPGHDCTLVERVDAVRAERVLNQYRIYACLPGAALAMASPPEAP